MKHFTFDVPEVEELPYTPGQFVSFPGVFHGPEITRAYSTASRPQGNRFELCLNRVQDGHFSPHLVRDAARRYGGDDRSPRIFYVAGAGAEFDSGGTGTGMAPFRGMLQWYLESGGAPVRSR